MICSKLNITIDYSSYLLGTNIIHPPKHKEQTKYKKQTISQEAKISIALMIWNNNKSLESVMISLNISKATATKYLKEGNSRGLCNFNPSNRKMVICTTTGEIFDSLKSAESFL